MSARPAPRRRRRPCRRCHSMHRAGRCVVFAPVVVHRVVPGARVVGLDPDEAERWPVGLAIGGAL